MDKYYDEFANVFCVSNVRNEIKHVLKYKRKYEKKKKNALQKKSESNLFVMRIKKSSEKLFIFSTTFTMRYSFLFVRYRYLTDFSLYIFKHIF